jgi:hypothetical protein
MSRAEFAKARLGSARLQAYVKVMLHPKSGNNIFFILFEQDNIQLVVVEGIFAPSKSKKTKIPINYN